MPKRNRFAVASVSLPELPTELWNKITKPLSKNLADVACVRLLNKRFAKEYEWELLRAGINVALAARTQKLTAKCEEANTNLAMSNPHRLAHSAQLRGELMGEGRLHLLLFQMLKEFMNHVDLQDAHPMRLALAALRATRC
tara:strand:- start:823 stop:1245 length:423 start_codon:yes stop_codon:yes gene_type:complete